MPSFVKSVTFDCEDPLTVAAFWAAALGSDVDEDSTPDRAWVEPAGWGGPSPWFHLGARVVARLDDHVVMTDPEGHEFCLET